jgi:hypothetical protein
MQKLFDVLDPLDEGTRARVLAWVSNRLEIKAAQAPVQSHVADSRTSGRGPQSDFSTFADLFNAASPSTNADRAMTAGYWLKICQGQDQFTGQAINKELQNLGHALVNVTDAFRQLQKKKPALAIQVGKSGKSQQSRKLYKLTQAGIDAASAMIQSGVRQ